MSAVAAYNPNTDWWQQQQKRQQQTQPVAYGAAPAQGQRQQPAGFQPAPAFSAPPPTSAPGPANRANYEVGPLSNNLPMQAIDDKTAQAMRNRSQDAILGSVDDARRYLADQFAATGMGRSGAYGGAMVDFGMQTAGQIATAGREVDINRAAMNADYGLKRADSVRGDFTAQQQALAQRAGLQIQGDEVAGTLDLTRRGQDLNWGATTRGQDFDREVALAGQGVQRELGLGQIGVSTRGQDIQRELELGSQGLQRELTLGQQGIDLELGRGQLANTRRGQDVDLTLGMGQLDNTRRGQDVDLALGFGSQGVQRELGLAQVGATTRGQDIQREIELGSQGLQREQLQQQSQQFMAGLQQAAQQFTATHGLQVYQAQQESQRWQQSLRLQQQQVDQQYQVQMQSLQQQAQQARSQNELAWAQQQIQAMTAQYQARMMEIQTLQSGVEMLTSLGVPASAVLGSLTGQAPSANPHGQNLQQVESIYSAVIPGYGNTNAGAKLPAQSYPAQQPWTDPYSELLRRAS